MGNRSQSDLAFPESPGEGHVANFLIRDLIVLSRNVGLEPSTVLDGTPLDAESVWTPRDFVAWATYARMWENIAAQVDDGVVIDLGRRFLELDSMKPLEDVATSLPSMVDVYEAFGGAWKYRAVDCMNHRFEVLPDGRLEIASYMAPGVEVCRPVMLSRCGLLEALPSLRGAPPARVEYRQVEGGAVYTVDLPGIESWLPRLRHRLRGWGSLLWPRRRLARSMRLLNEQHTAAQRLIEALENKLETVSEAQRRFVDLFQAAPVAMLICRASDLEVLDVNDKLLDSIGYDRDTVMSWQPESLGGWADLKDRDAVYAAISKPGGKIEGVETRVRHADGRELVALMSVENVELAGEPCILWQAVDITERKKNDDELAQYRERLEEIIEERTEELRRSNESLRQYERLASIGTLSAGIAHQINNPAGAIRAASEFALKYSDTTPETVELREALEVCRDQAERCGEIVRSILSFSRGVATDRRPIDLRTIAARSCDMVAGYAQEGGAHIETHFGDEEIPVRINEVEIEQVLVNVLRNAVECSDREVHIDVNTALLPTGAFLEVRDDGPGVDEQAAKFLFDPFFTTRLEAGGTGLGLSVAHGIVNAHGGAIRVDTSLAKGTAIQILLPVDEESGK